MGLTVEDQLAIQSLSARYNFAIDTGDAEAFAAVKASSIHKLCLEMAARQTRNASNAQGHHRASAKLPPELA